MISHRSAGRQPNNGSVARQSFPLSKELTRQTMLADRDALLRRLHELRSEHRDLDTVIARLEGTGIDQLQLQRLKKRKLRLKDEIAWAESRLLPDITA
jgi:hypothetical protein